MPNDTDNTAGSDCPSTPCSLSSDDILLDLFLAVKDGDFSNGEWNFDAYDQALKHLMSCGKLRESDL